MSCVVSPLDRVAPTIQKQALGVNIRECLRYSRLAPL